MIYVEYEKDESGYIDLDKLAEQISARCLSNLDTSNLLGKTEVETIIVKAVNEAVGIVRNECGD